MQTVTGLRHTRNIGADMVHVGYWPDGTLPAPGAAFDVDRDSGVRRISSNEWALVAGGAVTGAGGDAIRMRAGPKHVQVGIGQMDGINAWVWGAVNPGTLVHIQRNEVSSTGGDTVGLASTVSTRASSGGAGVLPDSSAASLFFIQDTPGTNGAGRALEAQAIRNTGISGSLYGAEIGVHAASGGNGVDLVGGIHMLSSDSHGYTANRADVGIWIRGHSGYVNPIRVIDETPMAQGVLWNLDYTGNTTQYGGIDVRGPQRRIEALWDTVTPIDNRTLLRSRTPNSDTVVPITPNGSGTAGVVAVYNSSLPANSTFGSFAATASAIVLAVGQLGIGGYLPLQVANGGLVRQTFQINGDIVPGVASLPTTANTGFQYIAGCGGTPTGTPTDYSGRFPMVYDYSAQRLWIYAGAWRSVTLS